MEMMIERRADGDGRIPLQVPVALRPGGSDNVFEAEAMNLGAGGLSMRARHLPSVGASLLCDFDVPPGEVPIEVRGEVVWAHQTPDGYGHFGLRFVELAEDRIALLAELLAEQSIRYATLHGDDDAPVDDAPGPAPQQVPEPGERATVRGSLSTDHEDATYNPWSTEHVTDAAADHATVAAGEAAGPGAPQADASGGVSTCSAELQLAVGASLQGELAGADERGAMFMQTLDMLALGDRIRMAAQGEDQREGSIADVRLVVYEGVPRLMIEVAYDAASAAAGSAPAAAREVADGDTVPDLPPPTEVDLQDHMRRERRVTMTEFPSGVGSAHDEESFIDGIYSEVAGDVDGADVGAAPEQEGDSVVSAEQQQGRNLDAAREVRLPAAAQGDENADERADDQAREGADGGRLSAGGLPALASAAGRASERLSGAAMQASGAVAGAVGTQVRTARRAMDQLLRPGRRRTTSSRKRRTTAGGARPSSGLRPYLVGALAMGVVGLGAYALSPADESGTLPQQAALTPAPVVRAPAASEPVTAGAPTAVPRPDSVPPDSPYGVGGEAGTAPSNQAAQVVAEAGPAFGAADVPGARRFTLRMTEKVEELKGVADEGGFRVIIPNSHSLDRAGPIAASHSAIHRSMILNKAGRSELTIRFADGVSPKYRVVAKGANLELLVADR